MANLTIAVDDTVLRKARIRALEQGTSINALLREYLESYAGIDRRQREAAEAIVRLAEAAGAARGGRTWTREDLHER